AGAEEIRAGLLHPRDAVPPRRKELARAGGADAKVKDRHADRDILGLLCEVRGQILGNRVERWRPEDERRGIAEARHPTDKKGFVAVVVVIAEGGERESPDEVVRITRERR